MELHTQICGPDNEGRAMRAIVLPSKAELQQQVTSVDFIALMVARQGEALFQLRYLAELGGSVPHGTLYQKIRRDPEAQNAYRVLKTRGLVVHIRQPKRAYVITAKGYQVLDRLNRALEKHANKRTEQKDHTDQTVKTASICH